MARANTVGAHIIDLPSLSNNPVVRLNSYKDLSTVWVTPSRDGKLDMQVVFQSWLAMSMPMNQKVQRVGIANAEVADAYNAAVEMILRDSQRWKYMLTVETDNLPPRDGLVKLYESMDEYDAVGGLYYVKGEGGDPMIYGNPLIEGDHRPQLVRENTVQECNGLGMGFTLFNVDMFRALPKPWFKTDNINESTQDLYFFAHARQNGFRVACDTRVKVGHIDFQTRKIW